MPANSPVVFDVQLLYIPGRVASKGRAGCQADFLFSDGICSSAHSLVWAAEACTDYCLPAEGNTRKVIHTSIVFMTTNDSSNRAGCYIHPGVFAPKECMLAA